MSGTVCSFSGCKKSYSQDKDVSFFCFPEDPKRRKKWMQNCGNPELDKLPDRQLRRLRLCSDHFLPSNFIRPESRTALNDSAVPLIAKAEPAKQTQDKKKVEEETPKKRGRGRQSAVIPAEKDDETPDVEVSKEEKQVTTLTPILRGRRRKETPSSEPVEKEKEVEKEVVFAVKSKAVPASPTKPKNSVVPTAKPEPVKSSPEKKKAEEDTPATRGRGRASAAKALVAKEKEPETPVAPSKEEKDVPAFTGNLRGRRRKDVTSPEPVEKVKEVENQAVGKPKAASPTKTKDSHLPPVVNSEPVKRLTEDEPAKTRGRARATLVAVSEKTSEEPMEETKVVKPISSPRGTKRKEAPVSGSVEKDKEVDKGTVVKQNAVSPVKSKDSTVAVSAKTDGVQLVISDLLTVKKKKDITGTGAPEEKKAKLSSAKDDSDTTKPKIMMKKKKKLIKNKSTVATTQNKKKLEDTPKKATTVPPKTDGMNAVALGIVKKKKKKTDVAPGAPQQKKVKLSSSIDANDSTKKPRKLLTQKKPAAETKKVNLDLLGVPKLKLHTPSESTSAKIKTLQHVRADDADRASDADSFDDEDMLYDRDFMESYAEDESDARPDREFERFYTSLKKFLHLSGRWTMGGVQWDPQGKRKVIIVSEPELPPNGRPTVKRCLQFFEDKHIRVFIDGMDMTDVFGMTCYAEKEDVAALISRVAEASTCCGVPEMVVEDLVHFPNTKKRSCAYFDSECPGIIPNDAFESVCTSCKQLRESVLESREKEKKRLQERRIRSQEKDFTHPFGEALYTLFTDLVDETDPTKPRKRKQKETFFRKFLTDTRYKINGDTTRTERIYVEKPISVDAVSASFQDIVSKLGFCMPNSQKNKTPGSSIPRSVPNSTPTPRPSRLQTSTSNIVKVERKHPMHVEHILPFTPGSSFTLDDGQEYELIGEVDSSTSDFMEMKPTPAQPQYEIIEVDDETLAKIASAKNQVVMLPESTSSPSNLHVTRIDANDPNLSQILKAINTSHGFKVT